MADSSVMDLTKGKFRYSTVHCIKCMILKNMKHVMLFLYSAHIQQGSRIRPNEAEIGIHNKVG